MRRPPDLGRGGARMRSEDRLMRLILVRHGQTTSNLEHLLDTGAPGADLTDLGRRQAAALPAALRDEPIEAVFASPLIRAQRTAEPLARALRLGVDLRGGVREIQAGDLEMLGDHDSVRTYIDAVLRWTVGDLEVRIPGGESGEEFFARYDEVIADVAARVSGTAVVVTHGAAIRSWTAARATNISTEFVASNAITNTGAVVLEGSPERGWSALSWEDHALGGPALDDRGDDGPASDPM